MPPKLPHNFFVCPPLDVDQAAMLADHAKNGLKTMVELARFQGGPITWTLVSDKDGVQHYSGSGPYAPPGAVLSLNVTNVEGTIDDAARLMRAASHEDFVAYCSTFAHDVCDCATLYTIRSPTDEKPRDYIGVKWQCYESPTSLVKSRDICFVEAQQDVELKNGVKGWARCMQSIELSCCPSLQDSHDLVRGWLHYGGYLFTETTVPGELQIINVQCMDYKGHVPQFLMKLSAKLRAKTLLKIQKHFSRSRSTTSLYRAPKTRKKCMLCKVGPQLTCSKCLQSVCINCNKFWKMTTPDGRKTRICYSCSSQPSYTRPATQSDGVLDDCLFDSIGSGGSSDHLVSSFTESNSWRTSSAVGRIKTPSQPMLHSPFELDRKSERFGHR